MAKAANIEEDVVLSGKVPKSRRILAFDLIRGLFLIIIMIDHIELYPSGFDLFTGKGRLWVSAAEGFFFLSGLLIGMMYRRRLHLGMKFIFKKMWTRAAQLYLVGTGLTLLYLSWAVFSHHPAVKGSLPVPFPWHSYLGQILLMRFTYGWGDFLVRFALLMLFAPIVFFVVAKGYWKLALAGIFAAWLFRGQGFTLAWQLLFNLGIIIGFYWDAIHDKFASFTPARRHSIKQTVGVATAVTFILSYASVFVLSLMYNLWGAGHLPQPFQHVAFTWGWLNADVWKVADKWTMGPLRVVLFFLWFTTLYWVVRRYESDIAEQTRGVLVLLGRNSLFVYTIHSVIVFVLKLYIIPPQTSFLQNFLITAAGLTTLIAITKAYKTVEPSLKTIISTNLKPFSTGARG